MSAPTRPASRPGARPGSRCRRPTRSGRTQRPDEPPGDGRARAQREEPLCLSGIEDGPGHRPGDRHRDRPDGVDRQPGERHGEREAGRHQEPLDEEHQRGPEQHARRGIRIRGQRARAPSRRPGGHEADRAEPDEQVREDAGPEAADGQRVDADLPEAAAGLHGGEQGCEREDGPGLARPDPERASPARHGSAHRRQVDGEWAIEERRQAVHLGVELGLDAGPPPLRAGSRRSRRACRLVSSQVPSTRPSMMTTGVTQPATR